MIILDSNGESCDGDSSEVEEDRVREARVEASNNFVFVGAEIRTGKSTIRSKQSKRKVGIQHTVWEIRGSSIIVTPVKRFGEPSIIISASSFYPQIATWPLHIPWGWWSMRSIQMFAWSSRCSMNLTLKWSISCDVLRGYWNTGTGSRSIKCIDPSLLTLANPNIASPLSLATQFIMMRSRPL